MIIIFLIFIYKHNTINIVNEQINNYILKNKNIITFKIYKY